MLFSIITVALNPGTKLKETIDSVLAQSFSDYEIIVKDGGSKDGSTDFCAQHDKIRLIVEKDTGIYDAMNYATDKASGDYILFLNCGDLLADEKVLERVAEAIDRTKRENNDDTMKYVFYGNTYSNKTDVVIASAPAITGFTCYRNIPCHQSCFYDARLCKEKPYDLQYPIRADYDHFLWCYYEAKATFVHTGITIASYEGGGFSESKENLKKDKLEHKKITEHYMSTKELCKYKLIMVLSLRRLRKAMAESKLFSGIYHSLKSKLYKAKL